MSKENHPSKQTLADFAQGKLQAESLDQVAQHIENCATCVEFLEQSVNDTLVDQLREAALENQSILGAVPDSGSFDVNQTQHFQPDSAATTSIEELFFEHPKYNLIKQIGSGGMGAVYEAQHRLMDRVVAIKVIRPELVSNSEAIARFHNEVRAAARLSHRNIVAAYDAEQVGSSHILVMEYVVGESLSQTIGRKGQLPVTHACNYVLQIAQGLKHAHERGMIHRDIKPQNLMKTPKGIIKILDFGLARINEIQDDDSQLTSTGVMMGTADYISPEQARSARDADIRSDLYSLGCTFFFLLAGEAPFKSAPTRVDKVLAHCAEPFPKMGSLRDDVPTQVEAIIQKLIAKSPDDRFQSPSELIEVLLPFAKPKTAKFGSDQITTTTTDQLGEQPTAIVAPQIQPEKSSPYSNSSTLVGNIPVTPIAPTQDAGPKKSAKIRTQSKWILGSVGGMILLLLLLYLFGAFNGRGSDQPNQSNSGTSPGKNQPKTVAAIFVYDQFCFGDFAPLRDRLAANDIRVITVSSSKRTAQFIDFEEDTTPNKQNVQIEYDLTDLETLVTKGNVDAIVFVGGAQLLNGVDSLSQTEGQVIERIGKSIRDQQGWIGAIGKGVNVPYALGLMDLSEIVDVGQWLETPTRVAVRTRFDRVYSDIPSRVISAVEWRDSAAMADEILRQLNTE